MKEEREEEVNVKKKKKDGFEDMVEKVRNEVVRVRVKKEVKEN